MTLRSLGIVASLAVAGVLGVGDDASACCREKFEVPKPHHYVDTATQANSGNAAGRRADTQNTVTFKRRKGTPAPKRETELLIMVTPRLTTPTN